MRRVSILGCGWLGSRIKELLQGTFSFKCATSQNMDADFFSSDVLILAMPPSADMLKHYEEDLKKYRFKQLILLSSTSIYEKSEGVFDEAAALQENRVAAIESRVKEIEAKVVVLRLAGLMGDNRIGGAKVKSSMVDGEVNYVHYYDIAQIIKLMIEGEFKAETFNVVAPLHPLRSELFFKNAHRFGFTMPKLEGRVNRIIEGKKLEGLYMYKYKNPFHFWDEILH